MAYILNTLIDSKIKRSLISDAINSDISEQCFAVLNGTDQYWQLSEDIVIPAATDFKITLTAARFSTAWGNLLSGTGFRMSATGTTGNETLRVDLDSSRINNSDDAWPINEEEHNIIFERVGSDVYAYLDGVKSTTMNKTIEVVLMKLGKDGIVGGNDFLDGYIKDLTIEIGGTLTHSISFTNKSQGATQLPNVGSVSATLINYDESVWDCSSDTGAAPINTSQPTVSGSSVPTEEAEVDNGTWESSEPVTYIYQWQLDGVDIVGATSSSILLLAAWLGQTVRCVVKATNSFGFTLAVSTSIIVSL